MIVAAPASTERFVLRLASATPAGELQAWLTSAAHGERVEYASGIDLPRGEPGVVLVKRWVAEGLVEAISWRDPADRRRWLFVAERTSQEFEKGRALSPVRVPGPSAPPPRGGRASSSEAIGRTKNRATCRTTTAREQAEALLTLLRGRAATGGACPTFAETVELLGLASGRRGTRRAAYLFDRLADQHLIAVAWAGPGQRRVVTIRAKGRGCGLSTAGGGQ